jgi:hypothetical protein
MAAGSRTEAVLSVAILAGVLAGACGGAPASPSSSSLSVGQWSGTTTQGTSITFAVSSEEILTSIAVEYRFNGCSGTQTFANLNVQTAPNVMCIPAPCSGALSAYRAFTYSSGSVATGPGTSINGLFLPGNQAQGQASFVNYPGCGTAAAEWTATRR